jgi:hypothetical protein
MIRFLQSKKSFPCLVELGSKKPSFGLRRYGKGLKFFPNDDEGFVLRGNKKQVLYKGRKRSHRFTIQGDKAFEYDCILLREPETNVISLRMEGAENFDFFKQPNRVKEPFLSGSYAVYKKERFLGHGTSKLCHIHRPEIIDARGMRCWGNLLVVGNELKITVPDWFLSEAKYPVIVDPILGNSNAGSLTYDPDTGERRYIDGTINLNKFLMPRDGNNNGYAYVFFDGADCEYNVLPCLYDDNNEKPMRKITKNEENFKEKFNREKIEPYITPGWYNIYLNIPGGLYEGDYLWFGAQCTWFTTKFDFGNICCDLGIISDNHPEWDGVLPEYFLESETNYQYNDILWSWYFSFTSKPQTNLLRVNCEVFKAKDINAIFCEYNRGIKDKVKSLLKLGKIKGIIRLCAIQVNIFMSSSTIKLINRILTATVKVSEALNKHLSIVKIFKEGINVHSKIDRISEVIRLCTMQVNLFASSTAEKIIQYVICNITAGVKAVDKFTKSLSLVRKSAEGVKVNSTLDKISDILRLCAMQVSLIVTNSADKFIQRFICIITAGVNVNEKISKNVSFIRKFADNIKANSILIRIKNTIRLMHDLAAGFDRQSYSILFLRRVSEYAKSSDLIANFKVLLLRLKDIVKSTAGTVHNSNYNRIVDDTVFARAKQFRDKLLIVKIATELFIKDILLRKFLVAKLEITFKSCIAGGLIPERKLFWQRTNMGNIYKSQSGFRLKLITFCELIDIKSAVIKYNKPDGRRGEWPAYVVDFDNGIISHECIEGEIDMSGWWSFWAFVTFDDGRTAVGESAKVYVWREGS